MIKPLLHLSAEVGRCVCFDGYQLTVFPACAGVIFGLPEYYAQYAATYSGGDYDEIWWSIEVMCNLFRTLALEVATHFGFSYRQEDGARKYLEIVKAGFELS